MVEYPLSLHVPVEFVRYFSLRSKLRAVDFLGIKIDGPALGLLLIE